MLLMTVIACLALLLAARVACLALKLADFTLVSGSACGPLKLQLYRRVALFKPHGDSQDFPEPRELRVFVLRLGGLPMVSRDECIGLPKEMDARLGQVSANEFDEHFSTTFRIAPRSTLSAGRALQMLRDG